METALEIPTRLVKEVINGSSRLIQSGTATVVWVLSRIQSLVVFAPGVDGSIQPQVIPWTGSYELPVGVPIRLAGWLEAEGESDLLLFRKIE